MYGVSAIKLVLKHYLSMASISGPMHSWLLLDANNWQSNMTHFKIVYKLFIHYFKMCLVALFVIYVVTNSLQSKRQLLNVFMVGKIPSQYIIFNYSRTCVKWHRIKQSPSISGQLLKIVSKITGTPPLTYCVY